MRYCWLRNHALDVMMSSSVGVLSSWKLPVTHHRRYTTGAVFSRWLHHRFEVLLQHPASVAVVVENNHHHHVANV